jgi:hypothetical protein
MNGVRPHLVAAQMALMEAAAQARVNQDRAVYQVADGHLQPALRAAQVAATITLLQEQLTLILDGHPYDH